MKNPKPTEVSRPTNRLPIDFAFASGYFLCSGPKESSLNFVHALKTPRWDGERCEVEDGLRGEHGLDSLIAPVVLLGVLLVAVAGVWHGGVHLGVGLGGALLRALLLLRQIGRAHV